jgi:hypothetical protein
MNLSDFTNRLGVVRMAAMSQKSLKSHILSGMNGPGHLDDLVKFVPGNSRPVIPDIDVDPRNDLLLQNSIQGRDSIHRVDQKVKADFLSQRVDLVFLQKVDYESDRDVIPSVGGKIDSHIKGGYGDSFHPNLSKPFTNFSGLVSLEMGPETNVGDPGFLSNTGNVSYCLLPVQKKGGPLNVTGPKYGKR